MSKIIIVEDDPMISEIYERKFSAAGFEVGVAASGAEVLKKARDDKFDLVLLDMVLPDMSGLSVLKELKQSGKYNPEMKVIIFSNLDEKEDQDKAFEAGADGFIPKTRYTPSDLVKEIQRMLSEYEEEKKNEQRRGNPSSEEKEGEKKRILFIEDEEIFLEMFGEKLRTDGYEVEFARNGAWGLKEALAKNFDLIILDVIMPAMTGSELIERLKLEEKTKNIPLIVLSASVDDEELKKVQAMGISDFFVKTRIVPSDLSKKVEEILNN
ncbi:MAG: response regulator [Candidatus Moranbacteria bacterium]|nr:response regulator [Candidatus Moranbacteria bacterium]